MFITNNLGLITKTYPYYNKKYLKNKLIFTHRRSKSDEQSLMHRKRTRSLERDC